MTSDGWTTTINKEIHWVAITVHWIDQDWRLSCLVIDISQLCLNATHQEILKLWGAAFQCYKLSKSAMEAVVLDGGSNFQLASEKFIAQTSSSRHWCACHRLHLVAKYIFEHGPNTLKDLDTKARKIVKLQSKSQPWFTLFRQYQEQFETSGTLAAPVPTRWNSVFKMFRTLAANRKAVTEVMHSDSKEAHSWQGKALSRDEWALLEMIAIWSECLSEALDHLQGEKYSTIDLVWVKLQALSMEANLLVSNGNFSSVGTRLNQLDPGDLTLANTFATQIGIALAKALEVYFPMNVPVDSKGNVPPSDRKKLGYQDYVSIIYFFLLAIG